ncbi:hypothetical protein, partial [Geobacillus thermoleovorans]|uniref:hypothetical protein n=1 Tax=Geobacillus thermoleovorans TaxID=33941 RepID=UPI001A97DC5B
FLICILQNRGDIIFFIYKIFIIYLHILSFFLLFSVYIENEIVQKMEGEGNEEEVYADSGIVRFVACC